MAGYIRQRGENSWQLTVYIGYDNKARKRRYANKTVHRNKRDAERALAKFVTEVTEGGRVATGPVSADQVLTRWLDARKPQLAPSTADRYRVAIKLIPDSIKRMPVAKVRAHHIEDLYADLVAAGQSGASIRKVHWALCQALEWACSEASLDSLRPMASYCRRSEQGRSTRPKQTTFGRSSSISFPLTPIGELSLPWSPGPGAGAGRCADCVGKTSTSRATASLFIARSSPFLVVSWTVAPRRVSNAGLH